MSLETEIPPFADLRLQLEDDPEYRALPPYCAELAFRGLILEAGAGIDAPAALRLLLVAIRATVRHPEWAMGMLELQQRSCEETGQLDRIEIANTGADLFVEMLPVSIASEAQP